MQQLMGDEGGVCVCGGGVLVFFSTTDPECLCPHPHPYAVTQIPMIKTVNLSHQVTALFVCFLLRLCSYMTYFAIICILRVV